MGSKGACGKRYLRCKRVGFGRGYVVEKEYGGLGCGADSLQTKTIDWCTLLDEAIWSLPFVCYI